MNFPEESVKSISVPEIYTQDYRHFDNLIWQVPAWSSAIFSFAVTGAIVAIANSSKLTSFLPDIDVCRSISMFLFSIFFVLLLLLNVFLRFRLHQCMVPRPIEFDVPRPWYMLRGQSALLLILFFEAAVLLCFALITAGLYVVYARVVAIAFLLICYSYVEMSVRKLSKQIKV